jgi:hypothetical protein
MKYTLFPLCATAVLIAGCISLTVSGGFSPVQGPLAQQNPLPAYAAKMSGLLSGTISVVLATGEVCQGPWAFVSTATAGKGDTNTGGPERFNLAADWDFGYGSGYYVAHVVGNKLYARATLTGNVGTIINVELSNETNTRGNTKGVAVDNHGNVFKVSVYN